MDEFEVICDEGKMGGKLIKAGIMTKEQVIAVVDKQNKGDARMFGEIAIEMGFIDESALKKYLESNK